MFNEERKQNIEKESKLKIWGILILVIFLVVVVTLFFGDTNENKILSMEEKNVIIEKLMKNTDGNRYTGEQKKEILENTLNSASLSLTREEKEEILNSLLGR